ncbi:hypothetical protein [Neotabrizicola sp. sgz301269]
MEAQFVFEYHSVFDATPAAGIVIAAAVAPTEEARPENAQK